MGGPTISASVIVCNEERYLRDALESIAGFVDQIVVVHDGPCADRTLDIAREFTADVLCTQENAGSAEIVRPLALTHCRGDWVFVLDADERLSAELQQSLRVLVADASVDSYGFAWPYVTEDGRPLSGASTSGKRFLFRRSRMYSVGLPHMTPDSYGRNVSRSDLRVWHIMKFASRAGQLRRMHRVNRLRGRKAAEILAGGVGAVRTFNADLGDKRVKNRRKIDWFARRPLLGLVTLPAFGFLARYVGRGYFRGGALGLHDSLDIPLYQAWTCLYRIRDRIRGRAGG